MGQSAQPSGCADPFWWSEGIGARPRIFGDWPQELHGSPGHQRAGVKSGAGTGNQGTYTEFPGPGAILQIRCTSLDFLSPPPISLPGEEALRSAGAGFTAIAGDVINEVAR